MKINYLLYMLLFSQVCLAGNNNLFLEKNKHLNVSLSNEVYTVAPNWIDRRTKNIELSQTKENYSMDFFTTSFNKAGRLKGFFVIPPPELKLAELEKDYLSVSYFSKLVVENDSIVFEVSKQGGAYEELRRSATWWSGGFGESDFYHEMDSIAIRAYRFVGNNRSDYSNVLVIKDFIVSPKIIAEATSERYIKLEVTNPSEVEAGYTILKKELGQDSFEPLYTVKKNQYYNDKDYEFHVMDSAVTTGKTYIYAAIAFQENVYSDTSHQRIQVPAINGGKWTKVDSYSLSEYWFSSATYSENIIYLTESNSNEVKGVNIFSGKEVQVPDLPFSGPGDKKLFAFNQKLYYFNNSNRHSERNNQVYYYSKITDQWIKLANKPYIKGFFIVGTDLSQGIIYGLFDGTELWSYNTNLDKWKLITNVGSGYGFYRQNYYSNGFIYMKSYSSDSPLIDVRKINVTDGSILSYQVQGYLSDGATFLNISGTDELFFIGGNLKNGYNRFLSKINTTDGTYTKLDYYNGIEVHDGQAFYVNDTLYYGLGRTKNHMPQTYSFPNSEIWKYSPGAASPAFEFKADHISYYEVGLRWLRGSLSTDYYVLYRKAEGQAEYDSIAKLPADIIQYEDKNLQSDLSYTYKIIAYEDNVQSVGVKVKVKTLYDKKPKPVTGLSVLDVDGDNALVRWNEVQNFNTDHLRLTINDNRRENISKSVTEYRILGLEENTNYRIQLAATNSYGSGTPANAQFLTKLNKPTASNLTLDYDSISHIIRWLDNSLSESGYKIERASVTDSLFSELFELEANSTIFKDSELNGTEDYLYRIYAFSAENSSGYSDTLTSVNAVMALENKLVTNSIDVYPNPVKNLLNIQPGKYNINSIRIMDMKGIVLEKKDYIASQPDIDVSSMSRGVYLLIFETDNGLGIKRIIKE